jgi:hypothetical protein
MIPPVPTQNTQHEGGPWGMGGGGGGERGSWLKKIAGKKSIFAFYFLDPLGFISCGDSVFKPQKVAFFQTFCAKIRTGLNALVAVFLRLHRAIAYAPSPQPVPGHDVPGAHWTGGVRQPRGTADIEPGLRHIQFRA